MLQLLFRGLKHYMRSKPSLNYSRIGGKNGDKLTKMAFAVLVKLAGLVTDLTGLLNELDYASFTLPEEDGPAKDKSILEALQKDPSF